MLPEVQSGVLLFFVDAKTDECVCELQENPGSNADKEDRDHDAFELNEELAHAADFESENSGRQSPPGAADAMNADNVECVIRTG